MHHSRVAASGWGEYMGYRTLLKAMLLACVCVAQHGRSAELVIPGSGDCEFALIRLAEAFEKAQAGRKIGVPSSVGSTGGVRAVLENKAVLGRVARALKPEEVSAGLKALVFGRDAVVFAVGERVGVKSLTPTQLANLFSGRVTNWRELGGAQAPVRLVVREETDTALVLIRAGLPQWGALRFDPTAKMVSKTAEMIELLTRYKSAIGWATYSAIQGAGDAVAPVVIGDAVPGLKSLANGSYPIVTEYALVYRETNLTGAASEFLAFVTSPAAREVLSGLGIAPAARK